MTRVFWRSDRRCLFGGLALAFISAGLGVGAPHALAAETNSPAIAQSFESTDTGIVDGALVSLAKDGSKRVDLASTDNAAQLLGVVADSALVEINNGTLAKVQVVTSGTSDALVSDINGDVKAGDRITASPIRGVGMRLTTDGQVIGLAQKDLSQVQTSNRQITAASGQKKTVKIGHVPVRVDVNFYATKDSTTTGKANTPLIQRLANAVAGKETSTLRVAISFTLLLAGFVIMVIILRTAVASSLISIGRNPLASDAIHKNFNAIAFIALGILLVSLSTAYLALVV